MENNKIIGYTDEEIKQWKDACIKFLKFNYKLINRKSKRVTKAERLKFIDLQIKFAFMPGIIKAQRLSKINNQYIIDAINTENPDYFKTHKLPTRDTNFQS
jgi:hypothetical protein